MEVAVCEGVDREVECTRKKGRLQIVYIVQSAVLYCCFILSGGFILSGNLILFWQYYPVWQFHFIHTNLYYLAILFLLTVSFHPISLYKHVDLSNGFYLSAISPDKFITPDRFDLFSK